MTLFKINKLKKNMKSVKKTTGKKKATTKKVDEIAEYV